MEITWENPKAARFLRRLASFSRLIVFDKRGTGLSDRVTDAATLEERMDDIRAVMDGCSSERAVVMGASEGAAMAALFAATYPERTVGLIIYGGFAKGVPSDDYPWPPTREQQLVEIEEWQASWGSGDAAEWAAFSPAIGDDQSVAEWWNKLFRYGSSPSASRALDLMKYGRRHLSHPSDDPRPHAHRASDRRSACQIAEARYIAERTPGSTFVELAGEGARAVARRH